MPIYEYRCGECRKKFERIVLSAAAAETPICPKCGAAKAERLVSRFATASKGGGDDFGDLGSETGGGDEPGGYGEDDSGGGFDEEGFGGPDEGDEDSGGGPEEDLDGTGGYGEDDD